jgi:hypothetical protein
MVSGGQMVSGTNCLLRTDKWCQDKWCQEPIACFGRLLGQGAVENGRGGAVAACSHVGCAGQNAASSKAMTGAAPAMIWANNAPVSGRSLVMKKRAVRILAS